MEIKLLEKSFDLGDFRRRRYFLGNNQDIEIYNLVELRKLSSLQEALIFL